MELYCFLTNTTLDSRPSSNSSPLYVAMVLQVVQKLCTKMKSHFWKMWAAFTETFNLATTLLRFHTSTVEVTF